MIIRIDEAVGEFDRCKREVEVALKTRDADSAISAAVVRYHARLKEAMMDRLRISCEALKIKLEQHFSDVPRQPRRSID